MLLELLGAGSLFSEEASALWEADSWDCDDSLGFFGFLDSAFFLDSADFLGASFSLRDSCVGFVDSEFLGFEGVGLLSCEVCCAISGGVGSDSWLGVLFGKISAGLENLKFLMLIRSPSLLPCLGGL